MKKLIIVLSGKKGAGKNTLANIIAASYLNLFHATPEWAPIEGGLKRISTDRDTSLEAGVGLEKDIEMQGVRIMAFATPLKLFCMNVLGLSQPQCFGSDSDKNSLTSVQWDGLPLRVRWKYRKSFFRLRSGCMTAREVMQVFGTDIIRRWHGDAWSIAGYRMAANCQEKLVMITDCRFPNEIELARLFENCHTRVVFVRLLRNVNPDDKHASEIALDNYPLDRFHLVVPASATILDMAREGTGTASFINREIRKLLD